MDDYSIVKNIEFKYTGTDVNHENINFEILVDGKSNKINDHYWEDNIPLWAVLYEMVKSDRNYTLVVEKNSFFYHEYEICIADNGLIELFLCFGVPAIKVKCEFEKEKLLEMLKAPLISAANDAKYMQAVFDPEYYDIVGNEDDRRIYQEYLDMLNKQIVPVYILEDVEKYNIASDKYIIGCRKI